MLVSLDPRRRASRQKVLESGGIRVRAWSEAVSSKLIAMLTVVKLVDHHFGCWDVWGRKLKREKKRQAYQVFQAGKRVLPGRVRCVR